jgi:demethylmenaquinone methyltransferase/2-methoxy-6-polyprenyl-1,4-benzoquinol methylase
MRGMPVSTSLHESNRAFYDRISEAYDLIADSNERAARLVGIRALALQPGESVLELGFGTGNEILDLASGVGGTGTVHGIDISPGMLRVARRKVEKARPAAAIDLRVADARKLPFEDASFDAAYSSFTVELFPPDEIGLAIREVWRVLRPGGRFSNVSMAKVRPGEHASALEDIYIWMHRNFPHIVDCRPIDAPALLTEAGFEIAHRADLEIWSMPVSAVVATKPES